MCVRAFVVLMQCTLAHHIKFVRASCVKFHMLLNNNKGQIRLNLISHVFTLNMNFPGYQFLVEKSVLNGRNGTVFALRFCGPPSWMRERVRSRIKSRPSDWCFPCTCCLTGLNCYNVTSGSAVCNNVTSSSAMQVWKHGFTYLVSNVMTKWYF